MSRLPELSALAAAQEEVRAAEARIHHFGVLDEERNFESLLFFVSKKTTKRPRDFAPNNGTIQTIELPLEASSKRPVLTRSSG